MSDTVNSISNISASFDLGPTGSLQFQFAKLQLAMAEICKTGAMDYIKQIQDSQDEQKKISAMMQSVRQLQADLKAGTDTTGELPADVVAYMKENQLAMPTYTSKAEIEQTKEVLARCEALRQNAVDGKGNCPWDKKASMMTAEDEKFFKDHGIKFDTKGNDRAHNPKEWDYNIQQLKAYQSTQRPLTADDVDVVIQSLQSKMDQIGSNTQQLMVFVQDFMGQYNSYLQGSNSVIQQGNQTLAELARVR